MLALRAHYEQAKASLQRYAELDMPSAARDGRAAREGEQDEGVRAPDVLDVHQGGRFTRGVGLLALDPLGGYFVAETAQALA